MLLTRRSSWNHWQPAFLHAGGSGDFPSRDYWGQNYQGKISGAKTSWGRRWGRLSSTNKSSGSDGTPWANASNICINQRNQTLVEKTAVKYFRPSFLPSWTINALPKQKPSLSGGEDSDFLDTADFTLLNTLKDRSHLSWSKAFISCIRAAIANSDADPCRPWWVQAALVRTKSTRDPEAVEGVTEAVSERGLS